MTVPGQAVYSRRIPALALRDHALFATLFAEHAAAVRETAMRVLRDGAAADDVVQEVFLALWRRPELFDPARGDLRAFLRLMARSRALDALRRADAGERVRDRLATAEPGSGEDADGPPAAVERARRREIVRAAVRALPPEQREAVVLHFWGGLTSEQIARWSGVPLGTAKSRVRLGLRRLERPCLTAV